MSAAGGSPGPKGALPRDCLEADARRCTTWSGHKEAERMAGRAPTRSSGWGRGLVLAILLVSALAASADTAAPASRVPRPAVDAGQGEKCVADTQFMRRNHMELLLHQRDQTVHAGARPTDTSLERCIACHASRKTGSVVGGDQNFCQGCHTYAAVKLDCFECHASRPEGAIPAANRGNVVGVAP